MYEEKQLSFEDSLRRLEEIVRQLDNVNTGLDFALECYEEGVRILKHCHNILDNAQRRIEILKAVDETGNPVIENADKKQFKTDIMPQ